MILPSLLLIGAAFGLGFAAMNILATAGVADHEQGLASGILQTSFQVGGAIVLAVPHPHAAATTAHPGGGGNGSRTRPGHARNCQRRRAAMIQVRASKNTPSGA